MPWFVYIVKAKDNSYYTGITTDLKRRVLQHNSKKGSKALFGRIPVELVYKEIAVDKVAAAKRESEIKGWTRNKKAKLIEGLP